MNLNSCVPVLQFFSFTVLCQGGDCWGFGCTAEHVCILQVPGQYITSVVMIPDIDNEQVSVTVHGSAFAANMTAQVQVTADGKQVCNHYPTSLLMLVCHILRGLWDYKTALMAAVHKSFLGVLEDVKQRRGF